MEPRERLAFALDVPTLRDAEAWIERLSGEVGLFKVGLELFIAEGRAVVDAVHRANAACFLDLKLHDIPETVRRASERARDLGVRYLTVHAAVGGQGLEGAAKALEGSGTTPLAVTVLTSQSDADLREAGVSRSMTAQATALARLAHRAGIHSFVCSPLECIQLKATLGDGISLVVPGIRPASTERGDQTRVATPSAAIHAGADVLVVGRPIRDAEDPVVVARNIVAEIERAQADARS